MTMQRNVTIETERFPIAGTFRIARGSKTEAVVIVCTVKDGEATGRGECVPYARYGETLESVVAQIEQMKDAVLQGMSRDELAERYPAGAARNAVDCALWDLEAKIQGRRVFEIIGTAAPRPLVTTQTISLGTAQEMAEQARRHAA